ncbi:MAG TPA: hypothetical protein VLF41_03865 [Candidatus Nanoarchaeia archaeon]|nr:hypothetical protein [Candidatus Nanoarchaeia archaeon]
MSEHLTEHGPEELPKVESAELEQATERAENKAENQTEKPEQQAERAHEARTTIEAQAEEPPAYEEKAPDKPDHQPTRLDKDVNYQQTMRSLQRQLKPASRTFSKIIHHPVVDATSEIVGKTVLRPSVTLGATVTAFVLVGLVYLVSRRYGFPLSGSELPLALVAGGLLGFVLELVSKLLKKRR